MSPYAELALRVDPSDVSSWRTALQQAKGESERKLAEFETMVSGYGSDHLGQDIDAVVASCAAWVAAVGTMIEGFDSLDEPFATAYRSLTDLQARSDVLWRDAQASYAIGDGVADAMAVDFSFEFTAIRSEEDRVLSSLADDVSAAVSGDDVVLDTATVTEVISRLATSVSAPGEQYRLQVALDMVADYGDGTFDGDYSNVDVESERYAALLAATDEPDPEAAAILAANGDPDFVDALLGQLAEGDDGSIDGVLDAIENAMQTGLSPDEVGLDPALFPPDYVRLKELEAERNGPLRDEYDDSSGWVWLPDLIDVEDDPDGKDAARDKIEANETEQARLRAELGLDGEPGLAELAMFNPGGSMAALVGHAGAAPLFVSRFGEVINDVSWTSPYAATVTDPAGGETTSTLGLDAMAPIIADNPDNALAFYNELGVAGSQRLVSFHEHGERAIYAQLADALGVAAGTGELEFTGADFADFGLIDLDSDPSPLQLLTLTDDIPNEFLVDATAQTLRHTEPAFYADGWERHWNMGVWGPYADLPDGVDLGPETGRHGLPIGTYAGQTEAGVYGNGNDHPGLVLLNMLGERDPSVTLDLMNELGPEDGDRLLRIDPHENQTPVGWENTVQGGSNDNLDRTTEILLRAASVELNGDQALSDASATWILEQAGNPNTEYYDIDIPSPGGDAVERILLAHPTVMVQAGAVDDILADAGIDRPDFDRSFDIETIDNAIEGVFRGGEGQELLYFQASLLPQVIEEGLAAGNGDPSALPDVDWLGEMDGRIDGGMERADIDAASDRDARNEMIQSATGTAVEAGLSLFGGGIVAGAVGDQVVGLTLGQLDSAGLFLPTNHELLAWEERWQAEDAESSVVFGQLVTTLYENGRLAEMPDIESPESIDADNFAILDDHGEPLVVDGQPVTLEDWGKELFFYTLRQDIGEN